MLDGRKEEMHEQIAMVLEREIAEDTESKDDLEKQITMFKHWNLSGNFMKAAGLALQIGGQLTILGLNSQADLIFSDVITGLKNEQGGETHGGICSSVLDAVEPPELELLLKVYIGKGKALCNLAKGKAGAEAYQSALDVSRICDFVLFVVDIFSYFVIMCLFRFFTTPLVLSRRSLIGVFLSLSLAGCL